MLPIFLLLLAFVAGPSIAAPTKVDVWKNVAISGANCWVTGIVAQPRKLGLYYVRTDVGGAYRWNSTTSTWIPITDGFNFDQRSYYGMESIAIDPENVNTVYIAAGMYTNRVPGGFIFKSIDQGNTWTKLTGLNNGQGLPMGSNEDRRWAGERLIVDPGNPNVVLFGSRQSGLWRSADGGTTWNEVATIPSPNPSSAAQYGVQTEAFDPINPNVVYAAVAADGSATSNPGVYISTDSGATFTLLSKYFTDIRRVLVGSDHALWITYGGGVAKYIDGRWFSVTPPTAGVYVGIAISPNDPKTVAVSSGESAVDDLYVTPDGGNSWRKLSYKLSTNVGWFHAGTTYGVSTLLFDTQNPTALWYVDGVGIWKTVDYTASTVMFQQQEAGHEETCPTGLACPPTGPELLVGEMDVDGFTFNANSLDRYPTKQLGMYVNGQKQWNGWTGDFAFEQSHSMNMVRIGGQGWTANYTLSISSDGGTTWNQSTAFAAGGWQPFRVAMSATDANNIVTFCSGAYVYTTDGGASWKPCSGLPPAQTGTPIFYAPMPLCSDTVTGGKFYFYDAKSSSIYVSRDGGANWTEVSAPQSLPNFQQFELRCQPSVAGDLWISEENDIPSWQNQGPPPPSDGLYHSADGGVTWTKLSTISRAVAFSFGKAPPNGPCSLFVYGRVPGDTTDKIYWSLNSGATWTNIQDPKKPIGNQPWTIEGSQQTFGRVFIGTGGRGVYVGEPAGN